MGISLIADVAVLTKGKLLLVRYRDINKYDHQPGWFLPDDALSHLEHPDRAVMRILQEQVGVSVAAPRLGHIESFRGNDGSWHLAFHYEARLPRVPALKPSPDIASAEWFSLQKLPPRAEVAHHGWALTTLRKLRGRSSAKRAT